MKKTTLFVIALFVQLSNLFAQDMLVFPESIVKPMSDIPLDACVRMSEDLMKADNKDASYADKLRAHGYQLLNLGQHEYAKEVFEKALEVNNEVYGKQDIRYVKALVDLAHSYMLLIRYSEAAGMFDEALSTVKGTLGEDSNEYLFLLNESAINHGRVYSWGKTATSCEEGVKRLTAQNKSNSLEAAVFYNNWGAALKGSYNYAGAVEKYELALKAGAKNPRMSITIAANISEAYALTGKTAEAQAILAKYIPLTEKLLVKKDLNGARVWTQWGIAYSALKDFDKAKGAFAQAFITNSLTFTSISSIPDQADDLMFKNTFLATCGQAGIMMYTIEMYKQLYEQTGDIQALKDGNKVVHALMKYGEKLMNSYLSEANKLILFRLGAAVLFDRSIFYSYELYKKTNEKKYIEDAFFASERSKSTLLLNALRSKENRALLNLPDEMLKKEKTYQADLKHLQKMQIEAATVADKDKLQQQINDLNIKIEHFKEELQKSYPRYYQHRYSIALSNLDAVQQFLAKKDNVLIEYALGLEKHYAFIVTKNSLDIVHLKFDGMELAKYTANLRQTLTNYRFIKKDEEKADAMYVESSMYFYNTFMTPVLEKIKKGQHLIIVPDQSLGHLPFETFLSSKPTKSLDFANYPYLLKDFPISYSYSATILLGQERHQQTRTISKEGVLAFAAEYPETGTSNAVSSQRGGEIGVVREGLQPLPGAKKEVETMEKHLFGNFFNGSTANEETFKKTAHEYGIIHLAMHGVLDSRSPILSSLVFSEDSSAHEDNFLRAYEIAQMDLNADLVVLSACETGYGQFQQGEGVMSLAHSFSYAGASSILMSLWQVNDYSTSQIMKNYYVNLAKGSSKENALRDAKLEYLNNPQNKAALNPAFWAAFVQTGDVEPLELLSKSGTSFKSMGMMMTIGGILLVLAIGFGFYRSRKNKTA